KPNLLLFITDHKLKQQLLKSTVISQFNIIQITETDSWIERLLTETVDVVIAQVDKFNQENFQKLTESSCRLLSKIDIIFISSGEPNPYIDKAMLRGVAYHLRSPIEMTYIEEIAESLFNELSGSNSNSEMVKESSLDQRSRNIFSEMADVCSKTVKVLESEISQLDITPLNSDSIVGKLRYCYADTKRSIKNYYDKEFMNKLEKNGNRTLNIMRAAVKKVEDRALAYRISSLAASFQISFDKMKKFKSVVTFDDS
ncbi:hypothetical protein OAP18_02080, partial [Gammaproteobacteria bacterium]|nr:hypothetical protein [Gammaproteobacteria bacterium]